LVDPTFILLFIFQIILLILHYIPISTPANFFLLSLSFVSVLHIPIITSYPHLALFLLNIISHLHYHTMDIYLSFLLYNPIHLFLYFILITHFLLHILSLLLSFLPNFLYNSYYPLLLFLNNILLFILLHTLYLSRVIKMKYRNKCIGLYRRNDK